MGTLFASRGHSARWGTGLLSPTASNAPGCSGTRPAAWNVPDSVGAGDGGGRVSVDRSRWAGARWRRDEDVAADQAVQRAALREDVQVDWADDEPGAAARGSGLGDAQALARHARQAAPVEGALLGFDGGHEYEAQ